MGAPIPCDFPEELADSIRDLITSYVQVAGTAELDQDTNRIRVLHIVDAELLEPPTEEGMDFWSELSVEDLAGIQGVGAIQVAGELASDVWESDEELHEFLDDVYRSRRVS